MCTDNFITYDVLLVANGRKDSRVLIAMLYWQVMDGWMDGWHGVVNVTLNPHMMLSLSMDFRREY